MVVSSLEMFFKKSKILTIQSMVPKELRDRYNKLEEGKTQVEILLKSLDVGNLYGEIKTFL